VTGSESARSVTKGLEAVKQSAERGLVISCARATRGLRRPSLDARSGRPTRPLSFEKDQQALKE
jgi:hypothetical protein